MYNNMNMQINNRNECVKLPAPQQEACLRDADKPYDTYKRELEEAIKQ